MANRYTCIFESLMRADNTFELLEALPTNNIFTIDSAAWIQILYGGPFSDQRADC